MLFELYIVKNGEGGSYLIKENLCSIAHCGNYLRESDRDNQVFSWLELTLIYIIFLIGKQSRDNPPKLLPHL